MKILDRMPIARGQPGVSDADTICGTCFDTGLAIITTYFSSYRFTLSYMEDDEDDWLDLLHNRLGQ